MPRCFRPGRHNNQGGGGGGGRLPTGAAAQQSTENSFRGSEPNVAARISCTFEPFREPPQEPAPSTIAQAQDYWNLCRSLDPKAEGSFKKCAREGSKFFNNSGHWLKAVRAAKEAWIRDNGNHLSGALEKDLNDKIPSEVLQYVRESAVHGAPARYTGPRHRVRARPPNSLHQRIHEVAAKAVKDGQKGRALVFINEEVDDHVQDGLIASPMGVVDKQKPDRSKDEEGRPINDIRKPNVHSTKWQHPPAGTPKPRQICRQSLWWMELFPGVPIEYNKHDVKGAFRLIWVRLEDTFIMVVEIPGDQLGLPGKTVSVISLVLPFGLSGGTKRIRHIRHCCKTVPQSVPPKPAPSSHLKRFQFGGVR